MLNPYRETWPSETCPDLNYLLSECIDHFWAGVSTSADVLSGLMYELSCPVNKERQKRLRKELRQADNLNDTLSTTSSRPGTPSYLDCVIRETLRLYPPISVSLERLVTIREASIDVGGHRIPEGTTIGAQAFSVHRNPAAFQSSEVWQPERWDINPGSDQYKLQKRHMFAFGAGPRMCIGMNVAESVLRHCVASIYRDFETSLSDEWLGENGELLDKASRRRKGLWPLFLGGGRVPLQVRKV